MATPATVQLDISNDGSVREFTWLLTTTNHTGEAVRSVEFVSVSFQAKGTVVATTFGGATIVVEGSLDGINFLGLRDVTGTEISLTDQGLQKILEEVAWIRPRLSVVGTAAAVTGIVMAKKQAVTRTN